MGEQEKIQHEIIKNTLKMFVMNNPRFTSQQKQLVIAQQQSGLSVTEYCRQQDIKYNAFYYWLRKIREEALESLPQLPEKSTTNPQFAVLSATTVMAAVQTQSSSLKLFCGPVSLEVNEQTSNEMLMQTLRCIKEVFGIC